MGARTTQRAGRGRGQRGGTATSPGSLLPPGTRRWEPNPSALLQRQPWAPGPFAPSWAPVGAQHRLCHPPPTGRTLQHSDRGAFLVPPPAPPFVFYLVLLFSSLWSFVPACPLFQRLWFLVPLMLCHSLHLGAFLSPGFEAGGCFLSLLCAWHFYPFSCLVHSWVTRARPGLSSNPHLYCVGAGFPCLYVLS